MSADFKTTIYKPLSDIFGEIVDFREILFRKNILKSKSVPVPVLSIGNMTFGGTGKTPICDYLLQNLKHKKKLAVISRGYGRTTKGFFKVDISNPEATSLFGDEPTWLATNHPDVAVFVCEDRVQGIYKILETHKVDLILADDAFQHLKLKRNFDIVLLDATEKFENYEYPPLGRARNSWKYLKRASCVFITKTNLSTPEKLQRLRDRIPKNLPVYEFTSHIKSFKNLNGSGPLPTAKQDVYLMSGIGKPETFKQLINQDFNFNILGHFVFKDHYVYTLQTLSEINDKVNETPLLVTQKDAVKLKALIGTHKPILDIYESDLEMKPTTAMDTFYGFIG